MGELFIGVGLALSGFRRASKQRGYRAERELVVTLWRLGFAVMRAPASGAKVRKAGYPDLVAIKDGRVAVFEVKSRRVESTVYLDSEQVKKLRAFAERAGGISYVAVKVPRKGWRFVRAEELTITKGGRYRVTKEQIAKAPGLSGVLSDLGLIKDLEKFMKKETSI